MIIRRLVYYETELFKPTGGIGRSCACSCASWLPPSGQLLPIGLPPSGS